tara:strand:+ start:663 stop:1148 length:486 start_codon:yes stop_codon:yes gene_type:complete
MNKFLIIVSFIVLNSCGYVEFTYNEDKDLINPLFDKTKVEVEGKDLPIINSYIPLLFGDNKEEKYLLIINIEETQTKRSVETNQATSNLRYELSFLYKIKSIKDKCSTYQKIFLSSFSIIPKSSGYNFGTDTSLEKKYELAVSDNLDRFISSLSTVDIHSC